MLDPRIIICSAAGAIQYLRWYVNILFEIFERLVALCSSCILFFFFLSAPDYTCSVDGCTQTPTFFFYYYYLLEGKINSSFFVI